MFIEGEEYPTYMTDFSEFNPVSKPAHYQHDGIETIDFIRAVLTDEQLEGYYLGNILKYVSRYQRKGGILDLDKAAVYQEWLTQLLIARESD